VAAQDVKQSPGRDRPDAAVVIVAGRDEEAAFGRELGVGDERPAVGREALGQHLSAHRQGELLGIHSTTR
jgi:hypothetical protein